MSTLLKVALNMSELPIPEKINKARFVSRAIATNAATFTNAAPLLAELDAAIDVLEQAFDDAADGGKTRTAVMHDKERELMGLMRQVAAYVEKIAGEDAGIVHLAALELKHSSANHTRPEFEVQLGDEPGSVRLRTRAHHRVFYHWQRSTDPEGISGWVTALTSHVCSVVVKGVKPGSYWFRVVLVDIAGEHPLPGMRLAVN
jgi:hypothetical protein